MTDLIKVDFSKKEKQETTQLPNAEEIFLSQALAKLAETQSALAQLDSSMQPNDKQVMAKIAETSLMSDHELLQSIHVGNKHDWQADPARYAALIQEIYARPTIIALLNKHA